MLLVKEKDDNIVNKGNQKEKSVNKGDNVDDHDIQHRQKDHENKAYKKDSGTDLAGHKRAFKNTALTEIHCRSDPLEYFFNNEETYDRPKDGVANSQADNQRELGNFVG